MTWECKRDGDCCYLFSKYTLGRDCSQLKEDGLCGMYSTRPKVCRVGLIALDGLDKEEYLNARCDLIHSLRKWKDKVGDSRSADFILETICKSGLR